VLATCPVNDNGPPEASDFQGLAVDFQPLTLLGLPTLDHARSILVWVGDGQAIVADPYVKKVNKELPTAYVLDDPDILPRDVALYTIVFGIISQSDEPNLRIPFFARVALKNVCRRLESIGYKNVCIAKISVDPMFKVTTKHPAGMGTGKRAK
jgi:hypothetical protein